MRAMNIREFKSEFKKVINDKKSVIVMRRKKPVGVFQPLTKEALKEKKTSVAHRLINAGKSEKNNISERHDEELYV